MLSCQITIVIVALIVIVRKEHVYRRLQVAISSAVVGIHRKGSAEVLKRWCSTKMGIGEGFREEVVIGWPLEEG